MFQQSLKVTPVTTSVLSLSCGTTVTHDLFAFKWLSMKNFAGMFKHFFYHQQEYRGSNSCSVIDVKVISYHFRTNKL
jgi:hypothetical protein